MMFLWGLLEAAFGHLIGQEIAARWPRFIEMMVGLAAKRLPKFYREETEKEWLSIISDLPGPISKLLQSADFFRAACWLSFLEYRITNRRDWLYVEGSLRVFAGAGCVWGLERIKEVLGASAHSRSFKWAHIGLLTFMVQGFSKTAEAHLMAADRFAELGNVDLEKENRAEGDRISKQVLDRIVDVAVIYALQRMDDEAALSVQGRAAAS